MKPAKVAIDANIREFFNEDSFKGDRYSVKISAGGGKTKKTNDIQKHAFSEEE